MIGYCEIFENKKGLGVKMVDNTALNEYTK